MLKGKESFVEIHEIQETEDLLLIIFDYIGGPTLKQVLKTEPNLSTTKQIILSLLMGVSNLNKNGIIHRDLKPENLIFQKNGSKYLLKILDFGLACKINEPTKLISSVCGTPGFMAPEIFRTSRKNLYSIMNSKIDIFAIGAIFHLLLFNKYVFGEGKERLENNRKGKIVIQDIEEKGEEFQLGYDLMRKMLLIDPDERISVVDAIKHQFFSEPEELPDIPNEPPIGAGRLNSTRRFKNKLIESKKQTRRSSLATNEGSERKR